MCRAGLTIIDQQKYAKNKKIKKVAISTNK